VGPGDQQQQAHLGVKGPGYHEAKTDGITAALLQKDQRGEESFSTEFQKNLIQLLSITC
jgi:hypothetical protein